MQAPPSRSRLHDLFIQLAEAELPPKPCINWSGHGVMTYFWPSPCERLEGLWVNVDEHEIMLATRLSHTHVDEHDWEVRNAQSGNVLDRVARQGIAEALSILNGETVFIKTFDPEGNEDTSSGMSPRWLWHDMQQRAKWTELKGEGHVARAWDWQGEVEDR